MQGKALLLRPHDGKTVAEYRNSCHHQIYAPEKAYHGYEYNAKISFFCGLLSHTY